MTDKRVRCDACGKPALEIGYDFSRSSDGIGGTDIDNKSMDLCHEHAMSWLQTFLSAPPLSPSKCLKESFSIWAKNQNWKPKDG